VATGTPIKTTTFEDTSESRIQVNRGGVGLFAYLPRSFPGRSPAVPTRALKLVDDVRSSARQFSESFIDRMQAHLRSPQPRTKTPPPTQADGGVS